MELPAAAASGTTIRIRFGEPDILRERKRRG